MGWANFAVIGVVIFALILIGLHLELNKFFGRGPRSQAYRRRSKRRRHR